FQAEDGIRDRTVTVVQTCALPICAGSAPPETILRQGAPRDCQVSSDCGPPERSAEVGRGTSGEISWFAVSARSIIASSTRPRIRDRKGAGRGKMGKPRRRDEMECI